MKYLTLLFLSMSPLLVAGDLTDPAVALSRKPIKGKFIEGKCLDYAIEYRTQLYFETEYFGQFLFFNWWDASNGTKGTHVIVFWEDKDGCTWGVDNQQTQAFRLFGSKETWVKQFVKPGLQVEVIAGNQLSDLASLKEVAGMPLKSK